MNRNADYRVGVGASSILMILVVLALAAMGLLSLSAARNSASLGARNMDMTVDYYEAAAEAQRTLAAMDATLAEHAKDALDATGWQTLLQAHGMPNVTVTENKAFAFSVDAGAHRVLEVGGLLTPDQPVRYTLTRHRLINTGTLETSPLHVLMPEQTAKP